MEFRPRSTFGFKTTKNSRSYRSFNDLEREKIQIQIQANKLRNSLKKPKLYSIGDINDKVTNSKGLKLQRQYKRLTDKELNKYFGNDKIIGWNYDKLFINNYFKSLKYAQKELNSRNNKKLIIDSNFNKGSQNGQLFQSENSKTTEKLNSNNINKDTNKKIYLTRPSTGDEKKLRNLIPATKRNDIWMPKNFQKYDLQVKNPQLITKKLMQEEKLRRVTSFSYNEIRKKMKDSDVFFTKEQNVVKNVNRRIKSSYIFSESDIFCRKNDKINLSKSGETYLFKTNLGNKYTASNESNSRWKPGSNYPNLNNCPSSDYNILSPGVKNNEFNKTKQIILEECKNINRNNNDNGYQKKLLFFSPVHKQKGMGEFIDITRNGSENPGRDFISKYKENPLCFQRNSEVCATFGDIYYNYKNVSTKPFMKERFES